MEVIKKRGKWLDDKASSKGERTIILLILGLLTLPLFGIGLIFIILALLSYEEAGKYRKGERGETLVESALGVLGDEYCLLNDFRLPATNGNVDHIVIGPNGIFVIETKNYGGKIRCCRDEWHKTCGGEWTLSYRGRPYWKPKKNYDVRSPSRQAKRNAVLLRKFLGKCFPSVPWIQGLVVFTNPEADLQIRNPSVPVLKVDELAGFIRDFQSDVKLPPGKVNRLSRFLASTIPGKEGNGV